MKLVNGFDLMEFAKKHHHVLPAFNTTNLEMTIAIAKGLMDAKLPGYIQISSNNLKLSNPRIIALMALDAVKNSETPIGLHLDHGKSFEDVKACVDAGFTSIMIDASHLPFEENIEECRRAAEYCHFYGIPVEAELGALQGKEEDVVNEAKINEVSAVPLVLHGGSGIPKEVIWEAKKHGLIKINYGSDLRKEYIRTFGESYEADHNEHDVIHLSIEAVENVSRKARELVTMINEN